MHEFFFKNAVSAEGSSRRAEEGVKKIENAQAHFWRRGVFFDVYALEDAGGKKLPWVVKDFRSGDRIKTPKEQAALFQHQYYEWNVLRRSLGEDYFPESYWIRNADFTDDQMHGFYAKPGVTPNTYAEVMKTQIDRQLADRYGSDDGRKGVFKRLMSVAGRAFSSAHKQETFIGAIIQERVNGIPFSEVLKRPEIHPEARDRLKKSTRTLIAGLKRFHQEQESAAFTWHGLESDNVIAEVDASGELTGRIVVLDGNFTERPSHAYRSSVLKKLQTNVFDPLEKWLES